MTGGSEWFDPERLDAPTKTLPNETGRSIRTQSTIGARHDIRAPSHRKRAHP